MSALDLARISDGGTLLEAAAPMVLDTFVEADAATTDDLLLAADWCASYEGTDGDELMQAMTRAVGYLMREVKRRDKAARVREVAAVFAKQTGRRASEKVIIDAAKKWVEENPS